MTVKDFLLLAKNRHLVDHVAFQVWPRNKTANKYLLLKIRGHTQQFSKKDAVKCLAVLQELGEQANELTV